MLNLAETFDRYYVWRVLYLYTFAVKQNAWKEQEVASLTVLTIIPVLYSVDAEEHKRPFNRFV